MEQIVPFTITLAGQSMIRGDTRADAPGSVPAITALVRGDAAFTNFEAAVYDHAKGETAAIGRFASPPESIEALRSFGFDLLSLANNHAFDAGAPGILNTLKTVEHLGIGHAGAGRNLSAAESFYLAKTPKATIALIALASGQIFDGGATPTQPGVNELRIDDMQPNSEDVERILKVVDAAKQAADIVIVSHHTHAFPGVNSREESKQLLLSQLSARLVPPPWLEVWARQLVDTGADVVALHGPPFLQGMEIYAGKPIFYSLGNFIFQVPPESIHLEEPIMWESAVAYIDFQGDRVGAIRLQPIGMNKIGSGLPNPHDESDVNEYLLTRGLPRAVGGAQARHLLERFAALSEPYGTDIRISGDVAEITVSEPKSVAI
jgi:poly-gamma-glutamate capsule biosynthesis protein CapA/YwtB (metallophosphatase superfamily)